MERLIGAGRFKASDFMVIGERDSGRLGCRTSTPLYPDWPFSKLAHTPNTLAKQVAQALLAMPPDRDGQSWTIPVDYEPVRSVFRDLKIGPYAYLRESTLWQRLEANWHWLTVIGLCLAWALVSLARVRYLVRLRTQQLDVAYLEAKREREKLEHAARLSLMGEMASSSAHEISQPLAAIVNYARGCQRRIADGRKIADIEPAMAQIVVQAERAATIVRRMRDFVRKRPPAPPWSYVTGAVSLALLNIVLFAATGTPWGVTTAFSYWAGWIWNLFGGDSHSWTYFHEVKKSFNNPGANFFTDAGSILDLGVVVGAFLATLLASQARFKPLKESVCSSRRSSAVF